MNPINQPSTGSNDPGFQELVDAGIRWLLMAGRRRYGNHFVLDSENIGVARELVAYFSPFLIGSIPKSKGILLTGEPGVGKTYLFQALIDVLRQSKNVSYLLQYADMKDIEGDVIQSGMNSLDRFAQKTINVKGYDQVREWVFDEGGSENNVKVYGNEVDLFPRIINMRYVMFQNHGIRTHIISNHSFKILGDRYGTRVNDRMVEMFNVIEIKGKSRRK